MKAVSDELVTQEMGVNIARMYQGFLTKGLRAPGGPEGFFGDVTQTTFVVKSVLYNAQTLILDAVVVRASQSHSGCSTLSDGRNGRYIAHILCGKLS